MGLFNLFKRKETVNLQHNSPTVLGRKNFSDAGISFGEFLQNNGQFDLSAFVAMLLYRETMPLFNAIDIRATTFSEIPIRLWDTQKKEFINDHPVLDLLAKPNADLTQSEFLYQVSSFFDITGNSFLLATGRTERPPLEIMTVKPNDVTFGFGSRFGFLKVPDSIRFTEAEAGQLLFKADEDRETGRIRFINAPGDKEAWHIRQFNPFRSTANFWGLSKARPLWLELQQFVSGNRTNLSMLKRGTRLSMAWVNSTGEPLTDDQWARMQEQAQLYAGDLNAGGTPILDGMDVKTIQQTNRDMEFNDMQDTMEKRIYLTYGIPLAQTSTKAMTLNNLENSQLQLYENATLPLAKYLYAELSNFLLPRYPDSENLEFRFNEHDIPALRPRIIETAKEQNEINVNTIDEIRALLGYEGLASGGDVILRPATLIPVGEDAFTEDEPTKPTARKYFDLMQKMTHADGARKYTDAQIEFIILEKNL